MEVYKDEINIEGIEGEEEIVVGSISSGIIFKFKDGKVSEIFMSASVDKFILKKLLYAIDYSI